MIGPRARLLLGPLPVTAPLYGPAVDLTGDDRIYWATALTVDAGRRRDGERDDA